MREKILFSWSSGKDSALALNEVLKSGAYEVAALLTTVTEDYGRVSMHGVRKELLDRQAHAIGLPLEIVLITKSATNEDYEGGMRAALEKHKSAGVTAVATGDIFLEDLRDYREKNLAAIGMKAVFPIWKKDTAALARYFIKSGFKAVVTCVDTEKLGAEFAGREFDARFVSDLPPCVDPCGENGEFHSFAFAGPIFKVPVLFEKGDTVLRDNRFCFCDLIPA
jgi:uncharacterized protein (TIGR00290 family)